MRAKPRAMWSKGNHTFENGFCTECGYINACQHDETGVESYIESIEVLSRDASGHTAVEHVFQRTVCNQCGQVLSEGSVENEVSGAHSYGESGTSGPLRGLQLVARLRAIRRKSA